MTAPYRGPPGGACQERARAHPAIGAGAAVDQQLQPWPGAVEWGHRPVAVGVATPDVHGQPGDELLPCQAVAQPEPLRRRGEHPRGLARGEIWTVDGRLPVSVVQEGLIRVRAGAVHGSHDRTGIPVER